MRDFLLAIFHIHTHNVTMNTECATYGYTMLQYLIAVYSKAEVSEIL